MDKGLISHFHVFWISLLTDFQFFLLKLVIEKLKKGMRMEIEVELKRFSMLSPILLSLIFGFVKLDFGGSEASMKVLKVLKVCDDGCGGNWSGGDFDA